MAPGKIFRKTMGQALLPVLPDIWRFSLSLTGSPDRADDLAQQTVMRAIERAHQFTGEGKLINWVLTICRSIWLNELRAAAIRKSGSLDAVSPEELIDKSIDIETNIFASEVFMEVMKLPEAQRVLVELVYVQGFAYREAANILDIPMGTVMSRLAAARKALAHLKSDPVTVAGQKVESQ